MSNDPINTPDNEDQTDLFPAEENDAVEVTEEAAAEASGGKGGARQFAPLPALPEGDEVPIAQYAERAYLEYAISVVKGRALPDVCDGQKPVQRRILYAMRAMGLNHGSKHVKSARVVGDVLGKYHPHGDSSAYEAMVRLAQDFSLRYPLVDGQGNFGTRDGDNAAAMRYTETRLTPLAELLLSEIDMGTVDFVPNYDGAFQEPAMLPARLPMVLLNGASGIAVGMATEIPSHNLREVAQAAVQLVRDPNFNDDALLACIHGPDFPGGGQIISSARDIRDCYLSGRGSLKMRARWTVEELARGQWQIVVHELPHGVSTRKVLEEIDELTNPKVKANKKSLNQDQVQNKQLLLSVLDVVADESDKSQAVRLVFQPKSSRQTQDELMNVLLAHTSLESSAPVNTTMIGLDGRPQQKSLSKIIREWVEFRLRTVRRRCEYRLGQVNDRLHILEGRMVVFLNLDEVIALIRESDDPKAALIARFELSERQAEDILEIRLRQLAKMEGIRIEKEIKALEKERRELTRLLSKESALRELVAEEIEADAATYGDERRTLIKEEEKSTLVAPVLDEPVTVIISNKHWVRTRQGHGLDLSTLAFKDGDGMLGKFECRTTDHCIVICDNGRVCSIPVAQLPSGRGDGAPLATFIDLASGAKIVHALCGKSDQQLLIATSAGYGFTCALGDMVGRTRAGKQFITVEKETILSPATFTPTEQSMVAAVSSGGRLLVFLLAEMKRLPGGGKGVILMGLAEKDELAAAAVINRAEIKITGKSGAQEQVVKLSGEILRSYFGKRARGGQRLQSRIKPCGIE
ncbi:MAG: DNA topoisomerase IV subunit A [Nitrosomonadales bacterium]|nr:DNA topoisomerase IV subunit A [Nitrosomonadales bacterium]